MAAKSYCSLVKHIELESMLEGDQRYRIC